MKRRDYRLLPLFAVGVTKGVYEVYARPVLQKQKASTLAWGALAAGVIAYDVLCPEGETLSEGYDHFLEKNKLLALGAIAITAGHLSNITPVKYDPLAAFGRML